MKWIKKIWERMLGWDGSISTLMAYVLALGIGFFLVAQWVKFLDTTNPTPITWPFIVVGCIDVLIAIGIIFWLTMSRARAWIICSMFALALLLLVCIFAQIYWNNGGNGNFSVPMSHLDAVYFALGTLTAGTGNISAMTEQARAIQSAQAVCDLLLLVFGAGIVVSKVTTARSN